MTKDAFITEHMKVHGFSVAEATYEFYRAYPVEKIKLDPCLLWLWVRCEELDRRLKQLENTKEQKHDC